MSRQDDIAEKAVRKSTLKSLKKKKRSRLAQLKIDYENAVQQVNILYAEDPERLKAKYAAAEYAKNEKAKKRFKILAYFAKVLSAYKVHRIRAKIQMQRNSRSLLSEKQ